MSQTGPWWDTAALNLQQCRAARPDCIYKEVCHRECYYTTGADGTPTKRCSSEVRLLKQCPGRDWETVSSTASQETGQAALPLRASEQQHSAHAPQSSTPLQPQLGEQWEEFVRYASDLQRQIVQENGVALEPEPPLPRQRHVEPSASQPRSIWDRLLRRDSNNTPGDKAKFPKLWKDYAAFGSIEEV